MVKKISFLQFFGGKKKWVRLLLEGYFVFHRMGRSDGLDCGCLVFFFFYYFLEKVFMRISGGLESFDVFN